MSNIHITKLDGDLDDIADLTAADGNIIVGNGTNWIVESGAAARTSLGVGTGDSPTFTGIILGNETLDTYDEGTFTPDLGGSTSNPTTGWATQFGQYIRIGNLVHIHAILIGDGSTYTGGSGRLQLTGLPFAIPSGNAGDNQGLHVGYKNLSIAAGTTDLVVVTVAGSSVLEFQESTQGSTQAAADVGDVATDSRLYISGYYMIQG
jgi:hypothetical protein